MFTGHDYAGADEYLVLDVYRDAVFVPSNNGLAFYPRVTEGTLHAQHSDVCTRTVSPYDTSNRRPKRYPVFCRQGEEVTRLGLEPRTY